MTMNFRRFELFGFDSNKSNGKIIKRECSLWAALADPTKLARPFPDWWPISKTGEVVLPWLPAASGQIQWHPPTRSVGAGG
jgi:hypothetical protein